MKDQTKDVLYQTACLWLDLTEYSYVITYGYKKKLYNVNLVFSLEDYPHLAGFQYLKDLSLPRYNSGKIIEKILDNTITFDQVKEGQEYEAKVKPRLEMLIHMRDILDKDFNLFSYVPKFYPFSTMIKADYLISSHLEQINFIFIIKSYADEASECNYLCCSAFPQNERNYEENQRLQTILKKERIHIPTQKKEILYDRLTPMKNEDDVSKKEEL